MRRGKTPAVVRCIVDVDNVVHHLRWEVVHYINLFPLDKQWIYTACYYRNNSLSLGLYRGQWPVLGWRLKGQYLHMINRAWNRSASFRLTWWRKIIRYMIKSYYCCCCINEPVIFSHCVHLKLGHWFLLNGSLDQGYCRSAHLPRYSHPVPISGLRNSAHTAGAPSPAPDTYTLYSEINNRVVDTVVHCDLVRSNSNNSLDPSVIKSLCVSLFSHWNSNGKSNARIVDLWAVHFKWWPIIGPNQNTSFVFEFGILALMSSTFNFGMYRRIKVRRWMVTVCACTVPYWYLNV